MNHHIHALSKICTGCNAPSAYFAQSVDMMIITKRVNQDASYQQCDLTWKRVKAGSIHLTRGDLFKANILDKRESEN